MRLYKRGETNEWEPLATYVLRSYPEAMALTIYRLVATSYQDPAHKIKLKTDGP